MRRSKESRGGIHAKREAFYQKSGVTIATSSGSKYRPCQCVISLRSRETGINISTRIPKQNTCSRTSSSVHRGWRRRQLIMPFVVAA